MLYFPDMASLKRESNFLSDFPWITILALMNSVVATVFAAWGLFGEQRIDGSKLNLANDLTTCFIFLVLMLICSFLFAMFKSHRRFLVVVAFKTLFLLLYLRLAEEVEMGDYAIAVVFLFEIAIYEAFFINAVLCALVVICIEVIIGIRFSFIRMFPSLVMLQLAAVSFCLLVHYREKCITDQNRLEKREKAIKRLTETNLGFQNFANQATEMSRYEERLRITRELHDIVGHTFTNNIMLMEAAITRSNKDPEYVNKLIGMARENAKTGFERIRESLHQLRSENSTKIDGLTRVKQLVDIFRFATQIEVSLDFTNTEAVLEEDIVDFCYSFVQESLTNSYLHGAATFVAIRIFRTDDAFCVSVRDNGMGSDYIVEDIGIQGMRERLAALDGKLYYNSNAYGFEIRGEIPRGLLREAEENKDAR